MKTVHKVFLLLFFLVPWLIGVITMPAYEEAKEVNQVLERQFQNNTSLEKNAKTACENWGWYPCPLHIMVFGVLTFVLFGLLVDITRKNQENKNEKTDE